MTGADPRAPLGVVVLGMHRSGTSVAARLVSLLGFSLGPEEDLVPALPDNPTGFWENASLVDLNDGLLLELGGDWTSPPRLEAGWADRPGLDALRLGAAALAASVLSAERWAWKDPRACLTLPFWLPILDRDVAVVLIHRNPLEVAASLQARNGFPLPLGLALWERYVRSALAASANLSVCVTRYEDLLADPARWCRRVADFLRARGIEVEEVAAADLEKAVRPDLRHAAAGEPGADSAVSPEQRAVYAALQALDGPHERFAAPELPPETPWVGALLDERCEKRRALHELATATARIEGIEASRSYRLLAPLRTLHGLLATRRT